MNWKTFESEINNLAGKINYNPDIIVGIVRGGMIPARLLSRNLKVKDMYCLAIRKIDNERKIVTDILDDLDGKKVLLVEDMIETGKSLIVAEKYLEFKGANVKTACLYIMPDSEINPDFYLREVDRVQKFPWE